MTATASTIGHRRTPTFGAIRDASLWVTSIPSQRCVAATAADRVVPAETAAASGVAPTIPVVWNADCSATVELDRLAGPHTGLWRLPHRLAHLPFVASPCDLGQADCKTALYQRCLTVGSQYDIYSWLNLPDLLQLWHLLLLPPGLKEEWTGALRPAGLLPTPTPLALCPELIATRQLATTGLCTRRQP